MNRKQKVCILVSITAIVLMGLYPPWVIESKEIYGGKVKYTLEPGPYSWIGSPPSPSGSYRYGGKTQYYDAKARFIDLYRLVNQYFMVAVVTAGLFIFFKDRKRSK